MTTPLPRYDVAGVMSTRRKIVEESQIHTGTVLTGAYYADWLAMVHRAVPDVPVETLGLSARAFLDRVLTDQALGEFAWRVAGNIRLLKKGIPVTAWSTQAAEEWMPLYVARAQPGRNRRDESGHWLTFRVMAGTACPMQVRRFWTRPQSRYVSGVVGFDPRVRVGRHFAGGEHFVGMLLYGLFEPRLSEERPGFHKVRVSATMRRYNVSLIEGRMARPCPTPPFHYEHPCTSCTIGYDICPLAVHARTFVAGRCAGCGRADALFDPERPEYCVSCTHKKDTKDTKA
jgi:hypothetical protein